LHPKADLAFSQLDSFARFTNIIEDDGHVVSAAYGVLDVAIRGLTRNPAVIHANSNFTIGAGMIYALAPEETP
jgi:hypothetical protein